MGLAVNWPFKIDGKCNPISKELALLEPNGLNNGDSENRQDSMAVRAVRCEPVANLSAYGQQRITASSDLQLPVP